MSDFLLEIYSEEIPALMQLNAANNLEKITAEIFDKNKISIPKDKIKAFVSPRRLTLFLYNLKPTQKTPAIERLGPQISAPAKAIEGFMKSCMVSNADNLEQVTKGDKTYYLFKKEESTIDTIKIVEEILPQILQKISLTWPKIMRWDVEGSKKQPKWIRPVRNLACIYGDKKIDLEYFGLKSSDVTFGNLHNKPLKITNASHYQEILEDNLVILDQGLRKQKIISQIRALTHKLKLKLIDNEESALFDEVTGLCEYPRGFLAKIDKEFLSLPKEILILALKQNQKYFCLEDDKGNLSEYFIFFSDKINDSADGNAIVKDNESVVRARLSDSKFFIDEDIKTPLANRLDDLRKIVFHEKLGSIYHKTKRVTQVSKFLPIFVPHCDLSLVEKAVILSKADLPTKAVAELPELQGKIGSYYALLQDENEEVASSIFEHYLPLGPNSALPQTPLGIVLSIADKIDSITGFFLADEKPTSSKDPYALRRAALGIIRIGFEYELTFPIRILVEKSLNAYPIKVLKELLKEKEGKFFDKKKAIVIEVVKFFVERLKSYLKDNENLRTDIVNAVIEEYLENLEEHRYCDILYIAKKVKFIDEFVKDKEHAKLIEFYKRAANILAIEEKKDQKSYFRKPSRLSYKNKFESDLYKRIKQISKDYNKLILKGDFANAFKLLYVLELPIEQFFANVKINDEDSNVRENRLVLLAQIRALFNKVADFSQIDLG